jgi:hypothetical protein
MSHETVLAAIPFGKDEAKEAWSPSRFRNKRTKGNELLKRRKKVNGQLFSVLKGWFRFTIPILRQ